MEGTKELETRKEWKNEGRTNVKKVGRKKIDGRKGR